MTLAEKCVVVTGGTGSFGHAVATRLLSENVGEVRILSRDEKKQEDMRLAFSDPRLKFYIGDVREYSSVYPAMRGADYAFHAAALKQVPSCEFYPMEAVRTNVLGAENVMNAAIANNVRKVVMLSTDKAVYPINAMGLSKALMEKLTVAKSRTLGEKETVLCATRYGNVMGSRGSVIPLFVNQVRTKKPLTVTDPTMTRFLMSLEESVELVFHAFANARQGDIFVQKAPAATIGDLATSIQTIFSSSQPVRVIGTRHGEKLYESLVSREEMAKADDKAKHFRIPADNRDLNYDRYFVEGETAISGLDDYTSHNTVRLGVPQVTKLLLSLEFIQRELNA